MGGWTDTLRIRNDDNVLVEQRVTSWHLKLSARNLRASAKL